MNDRFDSILRLVFLYRLSFLLVIFVIGAILNVRYLRQIKANSTTKRAGRKWKRIRDYEKQRRDCIQEALIGSIGIICGFIFWALPPCMDAVNEDYVNVEAIYSREDKDLRSGVPNIGGNIWIAVDENSFSVELYPGFSEEDFPEGTYRAIVCYGSRSKILLQVLIIGYQD